MSGLLNKKSILSILLFILLCFMTANVSAVNCTDLDGDGTGGGDTLVTGNANDGSTWRFQAPVTSPNAIAENFTVSRNVTILRVGVLARRGTPLHSATLDIHIRTNLSDPTTKVASVSIPATDITTNVNGNWIYGNVSVNLTTGTTYFFAVGSNLTGLNAHRWQYNQSGDPYPGGALWVNGAPMGKGDSDGTFRLLESGNNLSNCTIPNLRDCDDTNASIIPPYYQMFVNNDTYLCPGVYNISGPLVGITINRSNIKLVCMDTTLNNNDTSNGGRAIFGRRTSNISITGCTIQHYNLSYGIHLRDLINANVTNNTFIHNGQGFMGQNTTNVWAYNNSFFNHNDAYPNGFGLVAQQGAYNWTIQNNYFENSATSDITLYDTGSGNLVENNTCNSPGPGGIVSMGMNNTIIRNNVAYGHQGITNLSAYGYGIFTGTLDKQPPVVPEYRAEVYNNTVYNNDIGVGVLGNNSFIENNTIYSNTYGILSQNQTFLIPSFVSPGGGNNTIRNNNIYNNNNDGIYVHGSNRNTISMNTISNNQRFGIRIINSSNTQIINNLLSGNGVDFSTIGGQNSTNNTIQNTTFGNTRVDINYSGDFNMTSSGMTGAAPAGKLPIGKFLEIINATSNVLQTMINITMYYANSNVGLVRENTLRIWGRHSGVWTEHTSILNTTANTVTSKNITTFSNFGIFGSKKFPFGPAGGGGGGGAGISAYYKQSPFDTTPEKKTETEWPAVNMDNYDTDEEEAPKVTVKAPEIKTDEQKEDTELKPVHYVPSTKAIVPGILAVMALFGAVAYLTLIKSPMPGKPEKPSRRKDSIELHKYGFKVKK